MPADGFSKAKANSKPLQEFMATPEVSEWLEMDVFVRLAVLLCADRSG